MAVPSSQARVQVQLCHLACLSIAVRTTGPSSVKLNYHRPILTSHCLPASLWKFCELLCLECCIIPLCSLRPKNIVIRNHSMRFVEWSSWHNDGSPTCSDERNSTTTFDAECARDVSALNVVALDEILATEPVNVSRIGKQVGHMCWSANLLALCAVTTMKLCELFFKLEFHLAAQAATSDFGHDAFEMNYVYVFFMDMSFIPTATWKILADQNERTKQNSLQKMRRFVGKHARQILRGPMIDKSPAFPTRLPVGPLLFILLPCHLNNQVD